MWGNSKKNTHALFWDVFGLCLLWYISLNHGSIHLLSWLGKDAQSKWCWTVSTNSPDHFKVDLSFLDKFSAFVHNQPVVQNCSNQFKTMASGASFSAAGEVLHRSSVGNSCICTLRLFIVLSSWDRAKCWLRFYYGMYGKEHWKEQHILSPNQGRKSL